MPVTVGYPRVDGRCLRVSTLARTRDIVRYFEDSSLSSDKPPPLAPLSCTFFLSLSVFQPGSGLPGGPSKALFRANQIKSNQNSHFSVHVFFFRRFPDNTSRRTSCILFSATRIPKFAQ